jgi:serine/threonine protein kinase
VPYPPIGKYEIVDELGRGAMGIVFRARDPVIERYVAIKVIRTPAFSSDEETATLRMRLMREARAAGRLSHPGRASYTATSNQRMCSST